jgi:uncharacterized membrane protein YuzA (DUF378 family)
MTTELVATIVWGVVSVLMGALVASFAYLLRGWAGVWVIVPIFVLLWGVLTWAVVQAG